MQGETPQEIAGLAEAMQTKSVPVHTNCDGKLTAALTAQATAQKEGKEKVNAASYPEPLCLQRQPGKATARHFICLQQPLASYQQCMLQIAASRQKMACMSSVECQNEIRFPCGAAIPFA